MLKLLREKKKGCGQLREIGGKEVRMAAQVRAKFAHKPGSKIRHDLLTASCVLLGAVVV
jgi:hypothetical protein